MATHQGAQHEHPSQGQSQRAPAGGKSTKREVRHASAIDKMGGMARRVPDKCAANLQARVSENHIYRSGGRPHSAPLV
ncbi:hypothetical protein VITFI_CDS3451 (plasmid) [Vitreoscilla filiformis]|uniref:Uncharacterized protein n=1 Tax=Vitreoscilla filiformis TaxID=63 RepID=A0A221KJN1_VITFI|nr:hypothetical protein VITFI_CDS3451 [Vitreoscilla filiformis]